MRKGLLGVLGYCVCGASQLFAQSLPTAAPVSTAPAALGAPVLTDASNCWSERKCEPYRIWAQADYLLWWVKGAPLPGPLVTTGDPNNALPGAIGQPGTQILLGNSTQGFGAISGMRFTLGGWIDNCNSIGVEGSGFLLENRVSRFVTTSNGAGNPPLYVPITNTNPAVGGPDSVFVADPLQQFGGNVAVSSTLQLWGAELNGIVNVWRGCGLELSLLGGFRYMDLRESLTISTFNQDLLFGTINTTSDYFSTRNQFYGGQLGGRLSWQRERLFVDFTGKVALGNNHEAVNIQGSSTQVGALAANPGTFPGGIFAQQSNIGSYRQNQFSVLPSAELKVGYQLTKSLSLFAGYDILYWNQVVRPGNQIDHNVNTSQNTILNGGPGALVGPAQPAPFFQRTDFWAQGVTFGVQFRY